MSVTYRPIEELATEREFYLKLPYLAYENPWDQTMLAGYQGVEPLMLAPFFGGGLVACQDHRVLCVVPAVAAYDAEVAQRFTAYLWNPLNFPLTTRLLAPIAARGGQQWSCKGPVTCVIGPEDGASPSFEVPPRQVIAVELAVAP